MSESPHVVTPARAEDLPVLAELMADSPLLQRYGMTWAGAMAALESGWRAGDVLLTAVQYAVPPYGLAWVIRSRILTGAAYLRLLLVARDRQGDAVGSRLLREAETEARAWANHMVLLVTRGNAGARRFYERHGYHCVGDLPGFAAPGLDETLYHKALRPHAERLTP
ncbi:MAG: GNAT family N-acetyltransferase [Candidatus Rokuibacteriota bacterium]